MQESTSGAAITGVGQIHVSVTDMDRSVAFYRDVLGLNLLFEVPGQPPSIPPMAFLDCGGVRLYLGQPESPEFHSRPLVYYTVGSITDAFAAVVGRGAEAASEPHVVHRTGTTELWMASVNDPDGLPVILMSEVPIVPT